MNLRALRQAVGLALDVGHPSIMQGVPPASSTIEVPIVDAATPIPSSHSVVVVRETAC